MAYRNLDEFLIRLEQSGALLRVSAPVDPAYEISEITRRVARMDEPHNKALWFEQVAGSDFPVVTNLFGMQRRMAWALGVDDVAAPGERLARLLDPHIPQGLSGLMGRAGEFLSALRAAGSPPNNRAKARAQEVVITTGLDQVRLPAVKHSEADSGPVLAPAQIITHDPESGTRRVTRTQIVRVDGTWYIPIDTTAGMDETPVAVAIVLGGDPAAMWAAGAPLPGGFDPYLLAGWVRGKPLTLARCVSQTIDIPADAELVIEGCTNPAQRADLTITHETGFYAQVPHIAISISAITHARDAVIPVGVPGGYFGDSLWMNKAIERLYLPALRLLLEDVIDINLPPEGVTRHLALVRIHKRFTGQAHKVMYGLWGLGQLALVKGVVVVDHDVDVQQPQVVIQRVLHAVDWARDVVIVNGLLDAADRSGPLPGFGGKIGLDATQAGKPPAEPPPPDAAALDTLTGGQWRVWQGRVIVASTDGAPPQEALSRLAKCCPGFHVVLVDANSALDDIQAAAWRILAAVDWRRDWVIQDGRALVNATARSGWPHPAQAPGAVRQHIIDQWKSYRLPNPARARGKK